MKLTNAIAVLRAIGSHPLTRNRKVKAVARFVSWQLGSRMVPGKVAMQWVNSSRLLVGAGMWGATMNVYCGLQDFEEMGFLLHLLRPDDLFVDVGANVGAYTVLSSAAAGARTVAIEPLPATFRHLVDNVQLNAAQPRVRALNCGAADKPGHLEFTGVDTLNRVAVPGRAAEGPSISVSVSTLDELLDGATPLLVKIDAEGYETPIVSGAVRTLAQPTLAALLIEVEGHGAQYGFDETELQRDLERIGFHRCVYSPSTRVLADGIGDSANRIYVRRSRLQDVRDRLREAPRFTIFDQSF